MAIQKSITFSDFFYNEIIKTMDRDDKTNFSEFLEDIARIGMMEYKKKRGDKDE